METVDIYMYNNKYSTLPRGISHSGGRGKYSLLRVQHVLIFHKEGMNIYFIT